MNRVYSIHIMDSNAKYDSKAQDWNPSAEIVVPGLGTVSIKNCLSQETIDKLCAEVLFALSQKMGVKGPPAAGTQCPAGEAKEAAATKDGGAVDGKGEKVFVWGHEEMQWWVLNG